MCDYFRPEMIKAIGENLNSNGVVCGFRPQCLQRLEGWPDHGDRDQETDQICGEQTQEPSVNVRKERLMFGMKEKENDESAQYDKYVHGLQVRLQEPPPPTMLQDRDLKGRSDMTQQYPQRHETA